MAALLFLLFLTAWLITEALVALHHRPGGSGYMSRDRGSTSALGISSAAGVLLALQLAFSVPAATIGAERLAFLMGLTLITLGIGLRQYAVRTLGKYFTGEVSTQAGQALIQTGPYRWVRHPGYTGSLISLIGLGLALTNWLSLCSLVLVLLGLIYRIRVEERTLVEAFGPAYRQYMQRTKRLIPRLI
jgi:protein-S-isoprenylcysteine O-methyltransferase Ste14